MKIATSDFEKEFNKLLSVENVEVVKKVSEVISSIKTSGFEAVKKYALELESFEINSLSDLFVSEDEIDSAFASCDKDLILALEVAKNRVFKFHENTKPKDFVYTDEFGNEMGYLWKVIEKIGVYIPGGLASYPSCVVMNVIPAICAGVLPENICITTPSFGGKINASILAACKICSVKNVIKLGGAQSIALFAFGCDGFERVDKIVGPCGAFANQAKRQVYGCVGIDSLAGPTDVLIIAQKGVVDAKKIALDLLAQAEHGYESAAILITDSIDFAHEINDFVKSFINIAKRRDVLEKSISSFGRIFVVENILESVSLANKIAPEHLEVCTFCDDEIISGLKNAGAIFKGSKSCEALGDYILGPSHTLPTGGSARFSSGLSVLDFFKKTTLINVKNSDNLKGFAKTIANAEGLEMHSLSLE